MIKLTAQSGETVAVNPLHIFAVRPYQAASRIVAGCGAAFDVKEGSAEIDRAVTDGRGANNQSHPGRWQAQESLH